MEPPPFCSACGSRLRRDASFCSQCGAPVGHDAGRVEADDDRALPPGERRQVVVLFADLVGYTGLTSRMDAEDVHALLVRYFEAVDGVIASFGGTIDKHIGDAAMALFGAPVAHDNDPERAVRAACAIHAALRPTAAGAGEALEAHVGIASGEVIAAGTGSARHAAYTVTGDAVNLAARLLGLAGAGETLVSAPVWQSVQRFCEGAPTGPLAVKGLDAPVEAWRIERCLAAATSTPPLIGREEELSQFDTALASIRSRGTGRFLLMRGEAGIGKTRLVEAFLDRARRAGFGCHKALVLDFGVARGRGAIAALVAQLLGCEATDEPAERRDALARATSSGLVDATDEAFLHDLLELAQPERLRAAYEAMDVAARTRGRLAALAALVAKASRRQPRILVVEDLHWADALTLDGLAALARATPASPTLLVATTRIEGDPVDARWRATAGPLPQVTLDLDRLGEDEALALAHALSHVYEDVLLSCVRRSEGNPLFLVQLLQNASERAALPASIRSLVLSRVDRLAARDRDAVQAAAVIGQRFSLPQLRHLLGDDSYGCGALVDHFLVRPEGDEYLFAHALICDGAYASLLNSRKRELHARAAAWYAGRDASLQAQHLERAGAPDAAAAYVAAAHEQATALRSDAALALLDRALALATDPVLRHEARMLRAEQLREAGRTRASIEAFADAARDAPSDADRCRALIGVAAGQRLRGEPDVAMATLAQAQPLAEAAALARESSTIHQLRGNLHFARGEVEGCLAEHEAALSAALVAADAPAEASALSGLGDARYAQGRMRTALGLFGSCVELARRLGLVRVATANLCMMGHCRGFLCQWDEGLADMETALAQARQIRRPHAEMFALESLAVMRFNRGEHELAGRAASESLELSRAIGSRRFEAILLWILARIALSDGDRDTGRSRLAEVRAIMEATGIGGFIGALLCVAEAQAADEADERRRRLADGETWLARGSLGHCHFWYRGHAIDVALEIGDAGLALHHCDELEVFARAEPLPWSDFHVRRGRALVAWRMSPTPATRAAVEALREQALANGPGGALLSIDRALAT